MNTEIYEEKPKNKPSINIEKIEKVAKPIIRVVLTLVLWLAILILTVVLSGIFALTGSSIPALLFFVPLMIGASLTFIVWNEEIWQNIKRKLQREISANVKGSISDQIALKFKELKPEELAKIREGIAEFKEKFGLDLPLPQEKRKRDQIDAAIAKLSDSQLLDLKQGIQEGAISEDDLLDWLNEQEATVIGTE